MSSVESLRTETCTPFWRRAAASGSAFPDPEPDPKDGLGELIAADAHLNGSERDFKDIFLHLALYDGNLVHRLEQYAIAGRDVAQQVRLGVGVALVRSGAMGHNRLVEALLEFAAQAGNAALGFFAEFLLSGAILDGAHVLAHLELEVLEQRGKLAFKVANAVSQFDVAFSGQPATLLVERVLLLSRRFLFDLERGDFVVQAVEKARDIDLLRTEPLAGSGNDAAVEAEPLRGLNAGGSSGNAETQPVTRNERDFVHTGSRIEHAGRVGRVDLQRGVMRRDQRPGTRVEEEHGDSDRQGRSFFRIGGRTEFIEQDERAVVGEAREAVEVENVRRERGKLRLDRLRIPDVGEKCREHGEAGRGSGHRKTGLRHHGQQRRSFERNGFAAGVRSADDELARLGSELEREWDNAAHRSAARSFHRAQVFLEQRMARVLDTQTIGSKGRPHAVVVARKAGASQQAIHEREHAGALDQSIGKGTHLVRERDKDPVNLGLLLFEQPDELVVLLDGFERLHVDRLTRGTRAVHHARNAALELGSNRNDKPVASNGDDLVLCGTVAGKLTQRGTERLFNGALLAFLLAADAAQLWRSIV